MINVILPNRFQAEKEYIFDLLFNEFLELDYQINTSKVTTDEYIITFNNKQIIIKDFFFSNLKKSYTEEECLPHNIHLSENMFTFDNNIPVIYGTDKIIVKEDKIYCEIDIVSSLFFMLSRFEEHINKNRDIHGRFPAIESIAYKNNFLNRPVVNEYIEMLWNMIEFLGIDQKRKEKKFENISFVYLLINIFSHIDYFFIFIFHIII